MVFDEVQFPPSISAGATGGAEYSTDVVVLSSGVEKRNSNWSASRGAWDVSTGVKKKTDSDALITFFRARQGKARGFRFKDWTDFKATAQSLSPGTAIALASSDVTVAAAGKTYTTAGSLNFSGLLTGDSVYWTGFTAGGDNGTKTVVSATATVLTVSQTLTDEAAGNAVTLLKLGPYQLQKAYTSVVTYERAIQKPVIGTVVIYFAGVAHSTWWTIDTTTGIVMLVGGTAAPANGAALTADFQFDIPARFDTDKMAATIVDPGDGTGPYVEWQKVPVVETRDIA